MTTGVYSYYYQVAMFPVRRLERFTIVVEIIQSTKKMHRVRYMQPHANGKAAGYETWVTREKVSIIVNV